ncbi:MAG TPA: hypothetical protein VMM18_12640 [Gemmatimonadaceae bacterium]|nr:hypothetical protein [Gemmatimonadaceae bacterium]
MRLIDDWRADRARRRQAAAYAAAIHGEPDEAAVLWLANEGTDGDLDHARWELRYARRALGLVVARRDALDDRTPSLIAAELAECFARDPGIDPSKRAIAERQFNIRLKSYREAMERRDRPVTSAERLAEVLFTFAGKVALAGDPRVTRGAEMLAGFISQAHEALRQAFGDAALPDDVPPSAMHESR